MPTNPTEKLSLAEQFNASSCYAEKISGHTVNIVSDDFNYRYDFMTRTMMSWNTSTGYIYGIGTLPFSAFDREWLDVVRNKLIDLGGNPPDLPRETPAPPPRQGGLKL